MFGDVLLQPEPGLISLLPCDFESTPQALIFLVRANPIR